MTAPRMPQELQDIVIDNLPRDALARLCLVSHAWAWQSRKRLFQCLSLTLPRPDFLHFLHENPGLQGYVEELVLRGKLGDEDAEEEFDSDEDELDSEDGSSESGRTIDARATVTTAFLVDVLNLLPRVRALTLKDLCYTAAPPSFDPIALDLDFLVLDRIATMRNTNAEDDFLATLSLFRTVRKLKVLGLRDGLSLDDHPGPVLEEHIPPGHLRVEKCLVKNTRSCNVYLDILARACADPPSLKWLDVHPSRLLDIQSVGKTLQAARKSLLHLNFDFSPCARIPDYDDEVHIEPRTMQDALAAGLASCTQLRTCTLGLWIDTHAFGPGNDNAWDCLSTIVGLLPPSVQALTVDVFGLSDAVLGRLHNEAHRLLYAVGPRTEGGGARLKKVRVRVVPSEIIVGTAAALMQREADLLNNPAFVDLGRVVELDVDIVASTYE